MNKASSRRMGVADLAGSTAGSGRPCHQDIGNAASAPSGGARGTRRHHTITVDLSHAMPYGVTLEADQR
ncbi:hypothetical protein [Paenarthrobacter sp. 2TAF44]|uniref:hypothetical protein n=1 Tax=Paenarthrobacter sp. 2TAF44 TaxID=3233018 RepID=UPI003F9B9821